MTVMRPEMLKSALITAVSTSEAGLAKTATVAAVAGFNHYVWGFEVYITAAASEAAIHYAILKDGTTQKWVAPIPTSSAVGTTISVFFPVPVKITAGTAANLVVDALAGACISNAHILYSTEPA